MKQDLDLGLRQALPSAWENADRIYDRETRRMEALREKFTKRRLARNGLAK